MLCGLIRRIFGNSSAPQPEQKVFLYQRQDIAKSSDPYYQMENPVQKGKDPYFSSMSLSIAPVAGMGAVSWSGSPESLKGMKIRALMNNRVIPTGSFEIRSGVVTAANADGTFAYNRTPKSSDPPEILGDGSPLLRENKATVRRTNAPLPVGAYFTPD